MKCPSSPKALVLALCLLLVALPAAGAEVLLDEPLRLGDIIAFPGRSDRNKYYYVPVKARLATHETGAPMFSFLRWVQNAESRPGEPDAQEGTGGGLVHAVVVLGLSEEELENARAELTRFRPGASLEAPIVYNRGEFALVTSFQEDEGELTRQLVGVGDAPILEGGKAAISLYLTQLGSQILWESFNTPTPDVTFLFKMEMEGYRSPKEAILEASFDDIYSHRNLNEKFGIGGSLGVGVSAPVKVNLGAQAQVGGMLQAEIDKTFEELRQNGSIKIEFVGEDKDLKSIIDQAFANLRDMVFQSAPKIARPDSGFAGMGARGTEAAGSDSGAPVEGAETEASGGDAAKPEAAQESGGNSQATGEQTPNNGEKSSETPAAGSAKPAKKPKKPIVENPNRPEACSGYAQPSSPVAGRNAVSVEASLAIDLCYTTRYTLKRKRHTGTYRMDMRKYTAATLLVPFAENVGDLRRYLEDPTVFRRVNLDDPLYKQREIAALLSGIELDDFGAYLNSVAVQLRKLHESGDTTLDEVRIDRRTFDRNAAEFKLLYGWKGDDNRNRWMDYEWRVQWSFAGGNLVETDWSPGSFSVIPLEPPFERRSIRLEGSPELLKDFPVRSITVRLYYDAGGTEKTEQVTLRADKDDLSRLVELVIPGNQLEYDYEISWRLRGNKTLTSGRQTTTEDVLYVDELPEA